MSIKENDVWLEAAKDNFDEAVAQGNHSQARAVIADVRENGFEAAAVNLEKELKTIEEDEKLEDIKSDEVV